MFPRNNGSQMRDLYSSNEDIKKNFEALNSEMNRNKSIKGVDNVTNATNKLLASIRQSLKIMSDRLDEITMSTNADVSDIKSDVLNVSVYVGKVIDSITLPKTQKDNKNDSTRLNNNNNNNKSISVFDMPTQQQQQNEIYTTDNENFKNHLYDISQKRKYRSYKEEEEDFDNVNDVKLEVDEQNYTNEDNRNDYSDLQYPGYDASGYHRLNFTSGTSNGAYNRNNNNNNNDEDMALDDEMLKYLTTNDNYNDDSNNNNKIQPSAPYNTQILNFSQDEDDKESDIDNIKEEPNQTQYLGYSDDYDDNNDYNNNNNNNNNSGNDNEKLDDSDILLAKDSQSSNSEDELVEKYTDKRKRKFSGEISSGFDMEDYDEGSIERDTMMMMENGSSQRINDTYLTDANPIPTKRFRIQVGEHSITSSKKKCGKYKINGYGYYYCHNTLKNVPLSFNIDDVDENVINDLRRGKKTHIIVNGRNKGSIYTQYYFPPDKINKSNKK